MTYIIDDKDYHFYMDKYQVAPILAKALAFFDYDETTVSQLLYGYQPKSLKHNPALEKISKRLNKAMQNQESVFVFGDYDADGVCATTMMIALLKRMNIRCGYYIPNRLREGYGLNKQTVLNAHEKGYALIMTVDNGVSAFSALDTARECGMDVIICDHHIIPEEMDAPFLLHPSTLPEGYDNLCGAGVVLQLALFLGYDDSLFWILAMAATIGDMVEMLRVNRLIVQEGLKRLNQEGCLAITALLKTTANIDEDTIAYQLIPALNTLGRLADEANPNVLVEYLQLNDPKTINNTAAQISALNSKRKNMVRDAANISRSFYELPNYNVYLSDDYHEGIIGLLANHHMLQEHKPVLVGTSNLETLKFSGRSIKGFDIHAQLMAYQHYFSAFGGHKQACGFTIKTENFPAFIDDLQKENGILDQPFPSSVIAVELNDLTIENIEELDRLKPFGTGLKRPLFYLRQLPVTKVELIKNKYPKATGAINGQTVEIISFNDKKIITDQQGCLSEIIGTLSINYYLNRKKINILVEDVSYFNSD